MVLVHFITLLLECQTFLCVVCILYARQYISGIDHDNIQVLDMMLKYAYNINSQRQALIFYIPKGVDR